MSLDESQSLVIYLAVSERYNVFLTGQAGVGKSHCIGAVVQQAWLKNLKTILTATTGIAAMNLQQVLPTRESFESAAFQQQINERVGTFGSKSSGDDGSRKKRKLTSTAMTKIYNECVDVSAPSTLHKFALLKPNEYDIGEACARVLAKPWLLKRWREADLWIIDEVSMLSPVLFDMLDQMARCLRTDKKEIPFGGITMLFVGDFYQLPPVMINATEVQLARGSQYCFESSAWSQAIHYELILERVYRQGGDDAFVRILQEVRSGTLSADSISILRSRTRAVLFDDLLRFDGKDATQQTDTFDVDDFCSRCVSSGTEIPSRFTPLISPVEPTRLMAVNRQVDAENDARLEAIDEESFHFKMITRCTGRGIVSNEQEMAIEDSLTSGIMAPRYLELKRGAQVMILVNKTPTIVNGRRGVVLDFIVDDEDDEAVEKDSVLINAGKKKTKPAPHSWADTCMRVANCAADVRPLWPMVLFDNGEKMLVKPHRWQRDCVRPQWCATATQIPLKLAWAISIHKAQGMTISLLELDLANVFANGQAYVALSRVKSLDGLLLETFDQSMCTDPSQAPNAKVVSYYKKMAQKQAQWKPVLMEYIQSTAKF